MKTVALISGGKDSCFNMLHCVAEGHEIVALANLKPADKDELDSYMYQTVGHHAIDLYAEAMGLPLYRHTIRGTAKSTGKTYIPTDEDEVEDLLELLMKVKKDISFEAVSVGAILSDYQRIRVENVCQRMGLTSLAYLWRRDQTELLSEMIECNISSILIKVASFGLVPEKHLGNNIKEILPELISMKNKFELNVCGEGGEYETFTLDCPLFQKKIVLDETERIQHSNDDVGYLNLKSAHLEDKELVYSSQYEAVSHLKIKKSSNILEELSLLTSASSPSLSTGNPVCSADILKEKELAKVHQSRSGNFYITGVYAVDDDVAVAVQRTIEQLKSLIETYGWHMNQLCIVHLYVQNMDNFAKINAVYKTFFGVNPPCRICVQTQLPKNVHLQLDCHGNTNNENRSCLHVQSISHWASANIGPYSQATQVGRRIFVAGQIALVPGSMEIIAGGIVPEAHLSLRHVKRILKAINKSCDWNNLLSIVCYITATEFISAAQSSLAHMTSNLDQENDNEDDNIANNLNKKCVWVVVPRLPRNALIEWQVVADSSRDFSEMNEVCSCHGHVTNIQYCLGRNEEFNVLTCSGKTMSSTSLDFTEAAICMLQCLNKILISLGNKDEVQSCSALRIFYKHDMSPLDDLNKLIESTMSSIIERQIPYILVPVQDLENPSTVFAFSQ